MALDAVNEEVLRGCLRAAARGDLFVFAYGSLMWKPDGVPLAAFPARVFGYCRRLAVVSTVYRGTDAVPGLVFALDGGGSCYGMVLRFAAAQKATVMRRLFEREMFAHLYRPVFLTAYDRRGRGFCSLAFVARRDHPKYVAAMSLKKSLAIIRRAHGIGGSNRDYVLNAHTQLQRLGLRCRLLQTLAAGLADK